MYKFFLLLFSVVLAAQNVTFPLLQVGGSVVPGDSKYFKLSEKELEVIYSKENGSYAARVFEIVEEFNSFYEELFGWRFDQRLHITLASGNNQIANAYSIQIPVNRQVDYNGGGERVDYFAVRSWLENLLYHETAHNYQLNMKGNVISQYVDKIFGNGIFLLPFSMSVPNSAENSFMLEGNAVLLESLHGNGGRLYSGRFLAETILQAKYDLIKPEEVYNRNNAFPYGERNYIVGGFYHYYMSQKYGLKNVIHYFMEHSKDFIWPQFTNASMYNSVGVNFEDSLADFAREYKKLSYEFVEARGEKVASSQFFYPLNDDSESIYFLVTKTGYERLKLVELKKASGSISKKSGDYRGGKVFKVDGKFYTQSSGYTDVSKIEMGLFSEGGEILESSTSKVYQQITDKKEAIYFDIEKSFDQPQLYKDKEFYAQVNSSVYADQDGNLYYFVQNEKTRTLYKNKTPLYSLEGFYSKVCSVDSSGKIYFIANSKLGSTLYCFYDGEVTRSSYADNIIDARLINDTTFIAANIGSKGYNYTIEQIDTIAQKPYETVLFFENREFDKSHKSVKQREKIEPKPYSPTREIAYSGTDLLLGYTSFGGINGDIYVNFSDPLTQNALTGFVSRDELNITIAGLGYANTKNRLQYSIYGYKTVENDQNRSIRDYGVMASVLYPFYKSGYKTFNGTLSFYQDYTTKERTPMSVTLQYSKNITQGISLYSNSYQNFELFGTQDRKDTIVGAKLEMQEHLGGEFYISGALKGSYCFSDLNVAEADKKERGVKMSQESLWDSTLLDVSSVTTSYYLKSGGYGELGLAKVLNLSTYFFTFPISLQREALYTKYKRVSIESFSGLKVDFNQYTLGSTLVTIWFNKLILPISLEYVYTDAEFVNEKNQFQIFMGFNF